MPSLRRSIYGGFLPRHRNPSIHAARNTPPRPSVQVGSVPAQTGEGASPSTAFTRALAITRHKHKSRRWRAGMAMAIRHAAIFENGPVRYCSHRDPQRCCRSKKRLLLIATGRGRHRRHSPQSGCADCRDSTVRMGSNLSVHDQSADG
jgi:hypothetical protein